MKVKQETITYGYYFFSETLITFIALLPIFHYYFSNVPYLSYTFIMLGFTGIFLWLRRWVWHYGFYLLVAPIMFIIFYFSHFHWLLALLLTFYFLYRAIILRESDIRREQFYLRWALTLSVFSALFVPDYRLIFYLILLFLILFFGYLSRHMMVDMKGNKKSFNLSIWLWVILSLSIVTSVIFVLFPTVRFSIGKLWQGFMMIITFIGGKIVQLIFSLNIFQREWTEEDIVEQKVNDVEQNSLEDLDIAHLDIFGLVIKVIIWVIVAAIIGFLLWRAYQFYKQRFSKKKRSNVQVDVTVTSLKQKRKKQEGILNQIMDYFHKRPKDPIRRLIFDLEQRLSTTTYARYPYETIEEWLNRIEVAVNFNIYQDVRYGHLDVKLEDIEQLKEQVKKVKQLQDKDEKSLNSEKKSF